MAFLIPPSTMENQATSPLHSPPLQNKMTPSDVGIFKSTLLPSLGLYSTLSLATYVAAEATDRVELKDWLWPSAQVLNAWWTAIGQPMCKDNISLGTAWDALPWTERVLLSCVTIWGTRLFARIATRSLSRGKDDTRYDAVKKQPDFWTTAALKIFLPEALVLSVISLPFTVPFTVGGNVLRMDDEAVDLVRAFGVAVFGAGFAMEVMADMQLGLHRQERTDLCRHGIWGLVRHPKYVHA